MDKLTQTIQARQIQLSRSRLCLFLADDTVVPQTRLAIAPHMLFFAMGFKDVLHALRDDADTSPLQQKVNIHCDEDAEHWRWYLNDLVRLRAPHISANEAHASAFAAAWSDASQPCRATIYEALHVAKTYQTPFYRMTLIEALEATFACFNKPMYALVHRSGLSDQLEYFGQLHQHAEDNHAKDQGIAIWPGNISAAELDASIGIVDTIFAAFERMFDCWHDSVPMQDTIHLAA